LQYLFKLYLLAFGAVHFPINGLSFRPAGEILLQVVTKISPTAGCVVNSD